MTVDWPMENIWAILKDKVMAKEYKNNPQLKKSHQDNLVGAGQGQGNFDVQKADAELEADMEGRQVSKEDYQRKEWISVVNHFVNSRTLYYLTNKKSRKLMKNMSQSYGLKFAWTPVRNA